MPASSTSIFRKVALDRLASPEQLDRLITLTSPIGWATVAALMALIAAIIAWSVSGSVPTRIEGAGILVTSGGQVFDAMATSSGILAEVAAIGTEVRKGDVVARLDDTQAEQDLQHAKKVRHEQETQLKQLIARFDEEIAARRRVDQEQRDTLSQTMAAAQQRYSFYSSALQREEPIALRGFLTRRFVQETRQQMETAEQEIGRARSDLLRLDAEEIDLTGRRDEQVFRQQDVVNAARRTVDELTVKMQRDTKLISPINGHVTEVKASAGTVVGPGKPILSIETAGTGLEVILFIPSDHGKDVKPGMEVRIEPANVEREKFGLLLGRVRTISDFPVSAEGMTAILQNPQLVTRFSAHVAPYAARVDLMVDGRTPSGYAWTAGRGPQMRLSSGTTATAEVTIRTQAPITLVLPFLRQQTGIGG